MRKGFLAAMTAASIIATPALASDIETIAKASFKLYDGNNGVCSMTLVQNKTDDVLFLTAAHCVDGSAETYNLRKQVLDKDLRTVLSEQIVYLKQVKTIKKKDVALLKVRDNGIKFDEKPVDVADVKDANTVLKLGADLITVGYPGASSLSVQRGTFVGKVAQMFSELDKDTPMYQTTIPLAGGNSGGGLYAQFGTEWKLIGTATGMRRDNSVMTWFQTAETVQEGLRGFVKEGPKVEIDKKAIRQSPLGIDQR